MNRRNSKKLLKWTIKDNVNGYEKSFKQIRNFNECRNE